MVSPRSIYKNEQADTAITHMIFFIAAVILAMGVVSVLSVNIQSISGSTSANSKILSEQLRTDITVINDPYTIPYNSSKNEYTFYAKNTGKSELSVDYINLILDGVLIQPDNTTIVVLDGDVMWRPGDVIAIKVITSPLNSGDHSVRVVSENGKSDSMSFKI